MRCYEFTVVHGEVGGRGGIGLRGASNCNESMGKGLPGARPYPCTREAYGIEDAALGRHADRTPCMGPSEEKHLRESVLPLNRRSRR